MGQGTLPDFEIIARSPISRVVCDAGIFSFAQLTQRVTVIPYGRTSSESPVAVLTENRGTCSSKHRLLAEVAQEFQQFAITLTVGIYDMHEDNTPGVGVILDAAGVASIPEAHCYLKVDDSRFDFTGLRRGATSPFQSLESETAVLPKDLVQHKRRLHANRLLNWAGQHGLSLDDAWAIREACISALAQL
ncbi:MAG TPA: hypothetical protein VNV61_01330 [Steroidobacteraceae bacterium]|jgi:hypothetical protein|nr:hypothetical protein [Steroidobacteraceae bacterium]